MPTIVASWRLFRQNGGQPSGPQVMWLAKRSISEWQENDNGLPVLLRSDCTKYYVNDVLAPVLWNNLYCSDGGAHGSLNLVTPVGKVKLRGY